MSARFAPLVLCYHAVSATWPHELAVAPDVLAFQLRALVRRGYQPASADEVLGGRGRLLHVTFDDAYRSVLAALPALESLGLRATVFACPTFTDEGGVVDPDAVGENAEETRALDWDGLAGVTERGHEVGSHSLTHPRLTELSDAELERELVVSRERLEARLGRPCRYVAYPHGDHDRRVRAAARAAGYEAGFAIPGRRRPIDPFAIPRVGVYRKDGPLRLALKTSRLGADRARELLRHGRAT